MKLNQLLALLFLFCLCFIGCRDDEYDSNETEIPINTGIVVEGNLNGLIVDASHQPIPQVLIEVMGEAIYTDNNGFFRLVGINLDNNGSLVKISKESYFNSYKFAYAEPGADSYLKHVLPARGGAQYPNAAGATIPLNGGGDITIPPNSVTYPDGSAYNDRVYVHQYWYDPSDPNLASYMPGDLRGINNDGELVQLLTYGMIAVELETASGEPLQITETLPATLRFPIQDNFPIQDSIPMWHLDEETGHWIEEGVSVRQGNFMVAEVTHFSFWNCDAPFPLISLEGTIVDQNGSPLANQPISITTDNMLTGTGHTNENGYFRGKVPQGKNLQLNLNVCDNETSSVDLGSFDIDTDLAEVAIDINNQITVRIRLVDCMMGQPITGYAFIRTDISTEVVVTDEDGFISYELLTCNEGEGTIRGFHIESGGSSEIVKFSLSTSEANLEDLTVCETEGELGSIDYSLLGGETIRLQECKAIIIDETYLYIYGENPGTEPEKEYVELMFLMRGASHTPLGEGFLIQPSIGGYRENGEYLGLNFNPSILDDLPTTLVQDVGDELISFISNDILELAIKLEITQKINTGAIAGVRWLDLNQDGIQQADEPRSPDLTNFRAVSKNPNQELIRYYRGMPADTDGSYIIHGLVPNEEYKLTWGSGIENINISPANQGTDESKDCDFELDSDEIYATEYYLVGDGETVKDIGFGYTQDLICQITPRCCPVDGMYFHVKNGVAPFTVNMSLNGNPLQEMSFDQEEFELFTSDYGMYEVSITDAQGNKCMRTYEHNEYLNTIGGQTWIDEGDSPGQFDSNDGFIEDTEINLYNDDGELISTTYADPSGRYQFSYLVGDSYRVQVVIPNEYEFIELGDPLESGENHIDPQTGFSHFINVGNWDFDILYNINAGFKEK